MTQRERDCHFTDAVVVESFCLLAERNVRTAHRSCPRLVTVLAREQRCQRTLPQTRSGTVWIAEYESALKINL